VFLPVVKFHFALPKTKSYFIDICQLCWYNKFNLKKAKCLDAGQVRERRGSREPLVGAKRRSALLEYAGGAVGREACFSGG
jgi:hypothetical protein